MTSHYVEDSVPQKAKWARVECDFFNIKGSNTTSDDTIDIATTTTPILATMTPPTFPSSAPSCAVVTIPQDATTVRPVDRRTERR